MTSKIKVDNINKVSDDSNIIKKCGTTITLGASGDTINLAAGASQTGFGRTGSVNWDTTPKTTGFTAVSGNGYFCDTTSAAFTVTLPATPSAGDIVAIADYNGTAGTNSITVGRNSSDINGSAADFTISKNYAAISFVYVDATAGWRSVDTSDTSSVINSFVSATGGTVTCCGDYKIHTFTGPGTFTVTSAGLPTGSTTVDYLVVAGGGGSGGQGNDGAGGGGAGGFRLSNSTCMPAPLTSPLANPIGLTATLTSFPITVGAGGTGSPTYLCAATAGANSIFSTITSAGGGVEAPANGAAPTGLGFGGSGAAPRGGLGSTAPGGAGNTPPTSPPQGNNGGTSGGTSPNNQAGGGGGAGGVGSNGTGPAGGQGGVGSYVVSSGFAGCNGTTGPVCGSRYFAAGGGGGARNSGGAAQPVGGGGQGSSGDCGPSQLATPGTINTGSGGGGGSTQGPQSGGNGGSGIVVIRYKFQ